MQLVLLLICTKFAGDVEDVWNKIYSLLRSMEVGIKSIHSLYQMVVSSRTSQGLVRCSIQLYRLTDSLQMVDFKKLEVQKKISHH